MNLVPTMHDTFWDAAKPQEYQYLLLELAGGRNRDRIVYEKARKFLTGPLTGKIYVDCMVDWWFRGEPVPTMSKTIVNIYEYPEHLSEIEDPLTIYEKCRKSLVLCDK